jgi:hypothetical protein
MEGAFAGVGEGRMTEIVGERNGFGKVLVEAERPGQRARHLADLEGVGQAGAKMLALVAEEDLGLVLEAPEGGGMDDAVAVALEFGSRRAFARGELTAP